MKNVFGYLTLITLILPTLSNAAAGGHGPTHHCSDVPEGFHEWAAFGERSIFLSHFPMFGSIHSYQVIVEADFKVGSRSANDDFFAAEKSNPSASFTISPVSAKDGTPAYWVLPENVKVGSTFDARLHFQDPAGKDMDTIPLVRVAIKKIWINRIFNSESPRPAQLTYYYFGSKEEEYLAHAMTWDPDFDQILRVSAGNLPSCSSQSAQLVSFTGTPDSEDRRLHPGVTATGIVNCSDTAVEFKTGGEVLEYKLSIQH